MKSLLTNVPAEEALNCLKTRMPEFHFTVFEIRALIYLTTSSVEQITFFFNNKFYKKSNGLAVGRSISNIYMHYFEETFMDLNITNVKRLVKFCW